MFARLRATRRTCTTKQPATGCHQHPGSSSGERGLRGETPPARPGSTRTHHSHLSHLAVGYPRLAKVLGALRVLRVLRVSRVSRPLTASTPVRLRQPIGKTRQTQRTECHAPLACFIFAVVHFLFWHISFCLCWRARCILFPCVAFLTLRVQDSVGGIGFSVVFLDL